VILSDSVGSGPRAYFWYPGTLTGAAPVASWPRSERALLLSSAAVASVSPFRTRCMESGVSVQLCHGRGGALVGGNGTMCAIHASPARGARTGQIFSRSVDDIFRGRTGKSDVLGQGPSPMCRNNANRRRRARGSDFGPVATRSHAGAVLARVAHVSQL
jgi:hypothetical protein